MTASERGIRLVVDTLAVAVCATSSALALLDVRTPARPYLVLIALVVGVGWAATCWFPVSEVAYAGSLALAAGIAIPILVSVFFAEIHWWHPVGTAGTLLIVASGVNAAALVRDLLKRHRSKEHPT